MSRLVNMWCLQLRGYPPVRRLSRVFRRSARSADERGFGGDGRNPWSAFAGLFATVLSATAAGPDWHDWSDATSAQAKREHKFVLPDLEAAWCRWCHVVDETTYRDPSVTVC